MKTQIDLTGAVCLVTLSGRFDAFHSAEIKNLLLQQAIPKSSRIVIDMSDVGFVDSSALAVLVQVMKHCRQSSGDLRLSNLQQPVNVIFELTQLNKAIRIFPDTDKAIKSFGA